ncbi:unannotated protein [freshwater metagenome]|uniref:Unannotated protein n=1 Tax=freshwater metagenome TaxID=449393 RepID=A0A6J6RZS2_9ZZZZ
MSSAAAVAASTIPVTGSSSVPCALRTAASVIEPNLPSTTTSLESTINLFWRIVTIGPLEPSVSGTHSSGVIGVMMKPLPGNGGAGNPWVAGLPSTMRAQLSSVTDAICSSVQCAGRTGAAVIAEAGDPGVTAAAFEGAACHTVGVNAIVAARAMPVTRTRRARNIPLFSHSQHALDHA